MIDETPNEWHERLRSLVQESAPSAGSLFKPSNFNHFVQTRRVSEWQHLVGLFNNELSSPQWIFRGQASADWPLISYLERLITKFIPVPTPIGDMVLGPVRFFPAASESRLLADFKRRAHHHCGDVPKEDEAVDWLALMQHYGAPTRLLDWTRSPYVGAFFALEQSSYPECAMWAIDSDWLISTAVEALKKAQGSSSELTGLQFLTEYTDRNLLKTNNPRVATIVDPKRMNERVAAQQGVFLTNLSHDEEFCVSLMRMLADSLPQLPPIWKIVMRTAERFVVLRELRRMNITRASLFPGLDGFASSLRLDLECGIDETFWIHNNFFACPEPGTGMSTELERHSPK